MGVSHRLDTLSEWYRGTACHQLNNLPLSSAFSDEPILLTRAASKYNGKKVSVAIGHDLVFLNGERGSVMRRHVVQVWNTVVPAVGTDLVTGTGVH